MPCRGENIVAKKSFEQSMSQLEKIVESLESGDLPLEKAMKKFEEGVKLSNYCSEVLDETEKKVSILLKNSDGEVVENDFIDDEE